jgi:hypothetical protein
VDGGVAAYLYRSFVEVSRGSRPARDRRAAVIGKISSHKKQDLANNLRREKAGVFHGVLIYP